MCKERLQLTKQDYLNDLRSDVNEINTRNAYDLNETGGITNDKQANPRN